ncbi:MAG: hypothetical protein AB8C46_10125 [Burkholderiaceae bacterium]
MADPVGFDWFDPSKTMDLIEERQKLYDEQDKIALNDPMRHRPTFIGEEKPPVAPIQQKEMTERAQRWFDLLPTEVKPSVMRCSFPHILEVLCKAWGDPVKLQHEFDTLLLVDRGTRQGFPFSVLQELHCLRDYYTDELNPEGCKQAFRKSALTDQSR